MPPTSVENAQKSLIFLQGLEADSESNKKTREDYTEALTDYIKFKKNSEAGIKKCKDSNSDPVPLIKTLYKNFLKHHPLLDFGDPVYKLDLSLYVTMPPTNLENAQESLVLLENLKIGSFTDTLFKDTCNKYLNAIKDYIQFEQDSKGWIIACKGISTNPEPTISVWRELLLERHPILSPKDLLPVIKNENDLSLYVTMPPTNLENAQESLKFLQGIEPNSESNKKTRKDYIEALTDYIKFEQKSKRWRSDCFNTTTDPEVKIQEWHKQLLERHPILSPKDLLPVIKNENDLSLYVTMPPTNLENAQKSLVLLENLKIDVLFKDKYNRYLNAIKDYIQFEQDSKDWIIACKKINTDPEPRIVVLRALLSERHPVLLLPTYFSQREMNETDIIIHLVNAISHSEYRYSQLISSIISKIDFFY